MNIVYDQCSLTSSVHQALFGEKYKQLSENSLEVCHDDTTGFEFEAGCDVTQSSLIDSDDECWSIQCHQKC